MFATTLLPNIAILSASNSQATRLDELLFGEVVQVFQVDKEYAYVKHLFTNREGFIRKNQLSHVSEDYARKFETGMLFRLSFPVSSIENERTGIQNFICAGAICSQSKNSIELANEQFSAPNPNHFLIPNNKTEELLRDAALLYLNAPENAGGRSVFGIDPVLFIAQVYAFAHIHIGNTLDEMTQKGHLIDFIHEIKCGDVAFFEDSQNQIIHAGICIGDNWILHCDGKVKSGRLDQQGLFDPKENGYIYNLRLIKRYF